MKHKMNLKLIGALSAILITGMTIPVAAAPLSETIALTDNPAQAVVAATESELANGTYTISGKMWHATLNQQSMGNAALKQPMTLIVKDGQCHLRMEFGSLTIGPLMGYLGSLSYYPNVESNRLPTPEDLAIPLTVESNYDGVYDNFNNPETGTDTIMKGKLYPHYMSMPVEYNDSEIWVQVYVPIMESITAGSGTQYARLQLDWSTLMAVDVPDTEPEEPAEVDKSALKSAIDSAREALARTDIAYTDESRAVVETVLAATQAIYDDENVLQTDVDAQVTALQTAVQELEEQVSSPEEPLDIQNLEDGIYALQGHMVKIDKTTASMSDNAINHTIKLTVENGEYTLTMDFKGLTISNQLGYLGTLAYYQSGYTLDSYGNPVGSTTPATVLSYQTDANGNKLTDNFGTDYPDLVSFPMIEEAKDDGYVPLKVFVPIMENISAGTGTQNVFLQLDLETLEVTTADDPAFSEEDTTDQSQNSGLNTGSNSLSNTLPNGLKKSSLTSGSLSKNNTMKANVATGIERDADLLIAGAVGTATLAGVIGVATVRKRRNEEK